MKVALQLLLVLVWTVTACLNLKSNWFNFHLSEVLMWSHFILPASLIMVISHYYRAVKKGGSKKEYKLETGLVTIALIFNLMQYAYNLHINKFLTEGEALITLYALNPLIIYFYLYSVLFELLSKKEDSPK